MRRNTESGLECNVEYGALSSIHLALAQSTRGVAHGAAHGRPSTSGQGGMPSGNHCMRLGWAGFAMVAFATYRACPAASLGWNAMSTPKLDRVDLRILEALQGNARLSSADLAERGQLSSSPCWRRVKRLEEEGVIRGYAARLDAGLLGKRCTRRSCLRKQVIGGAR